MDSGYMNETSTTFTFDVQEFTKIKILILDRSNDSTVTPIQVREMVVHEFGHALGYRDHSPYSDDVMFASGGSVMGFTLTQREIQHLKAIYDRFA
jgi:predicted Zn-dependent protease